jgi:hypothetical protein
MGIITNNGLKCRFSEFEKESESQLTGAEYTSAPACTDGDIAAQNLIICALPSCTFHSGKSVALIYILLCAACVRAKLQSADLMLDAGCHAERKYDAAIAYIYK